MSLSKLESALSIIWKQLPNKSNNSSYNNFVKTLSFATLFSNIASLEEFIWSLSILPFLVEFYLQKHNHFHLAMIEIFAKAIYQVHLISNLSTCLALKKWSCFVTSLFQVVLCIDGSLSETFTGFNSVSDCKVTLFSTALLRLTELRPVSLSLGICGSSNVISFLLNFFFLLFQIPLLEFFLCSCNASTTK